MLVGVAGGGNGRALTSAMIEPQERRPPVVTRLEIAIGAILFGVVVLAGVLMMGRLPT